jgi:HK97 family phage portal protein
VIVEAFFSMFSAISFAGSHPRDPAIAKMLGFGKENSAGVSVTEEKVLALPAIKRAIQIITDKMFGMPWYVFEEKEDGRDWYRQHASWRAVNWMANEELSAPSMRQILTQWAMTWGNGCAWIDRSGDKVNLYPLLPDRTRPVRLNNNQADLMGDSSLAGKLFIETKIGGERKVIPYDNVLHIKGISANGFWGLDIIELLAETFGGAMAKEEFSNRFFSNGATPVGFVTMEGSLDEESEETYMQSLAKAMSGLGKAHKVILLEEGAKFQPVTIDPMKSQMLEGKQFDVRLLAMAIGIKPHKLIDSANSAFASLEQANHEHKDDDILPWVNKFRAEYDRKLLNGTEGESGMFSIDVDDETLDWVPFAERSRGAVDLYNNGLITKDEGRRKVNFGPSKTARAKQYRIPANIMYEDDAAMVNTDPSSQSDDESAKYQDVVDDSLGKIEKRLIAQAKAKAKNPKEFLAWLDALKPESGPSSIQTQIDELYAKTIGRLNDLAASTHSAEELSNAI